MVNERGLRTILLVLGLAIVGLLILAVSQWAGGDKATSLALVAGIATLALAFAAVLTLEQNRSLVKAAADQATALRDAVDQDRSLLKSASDQAAASWETVEEMRRERELAYKPLLVLTEGDPDPPPVGQVAPMSFLTAYVVRNIGTGPALNVDLCARWFQGSPRGYSWISFHVQGLSAGSEVRVAKVFGSDEGADGARRSRYRCLVEDWPVNEDEQVVAVRYEDWFQTHYRSPGGRDAPLPTEWRGRLGSLDQPSWLRCT